MESVIERLDTQSSDLEDEQMSVKTDAEVIIGDKVITLTGYESEEYLQRVASYINKKINEYNKMDSFKRQPIEMQNILMQLNIADDYFKVQKQNAVLEEELQRKEKELYDLKHELVACQMKMDTVERAQRDMKEKLEEAEKNVVKLETELQNRRR